jgi:hypothetical protein
MKPRRRALEDGLAHDHVVPGQDVALRVEADLGAVHVHGPVVAALDVVLAAPQRAHRRVDAGARAAFATWQASTT